MFISIVHSFAVCTFIKVDAIVCDGGTTNRGVWKEFGIDGHKDSLVNSVRHPMADVSSQRTDADRLYFFSDYVHLFKCIRNNLLNAKSFSVR